MAIKRRAKFADIEASALFDNLSKATVWELFMDLMERNFGEEQIYQDNFFSETLSPALKKGNFSFGAELDNEMEAKIEKARKDAIKYKELMERRIRIENEQNQ